MQSERTLDYENRVLILFESADGHPNPLISQMISTYSNPRIRFRSYKSFDELQTNVLQFLPQFESLGNE
jgi:hypothetical protein